MSDYNEANKTYAAALKVRENAFAPYSKFKVGAAFLTKSGEIFSGANVENVSFGATVCAERNAIGAMIAQIGKQELEHLVVVTHETQGVGPCGICLQFLSEFVPNDFPIYLANLNEIVGKVSYGELNPSAFRSFS